tara:strand:+ start:72 stop:269 length:198 start_codon:yes stop_codon:yes gene_type:complete
MSKEDKFYLLCKIWPWIGGVLAGASIFTGSFIIFGFVVMASVILTIWLSLFTNKMGAKLDGKEQV